MAIINGTANNDFLKGTTNSDTIFGYQGNDTIDIQANELYDQVDGGDGNDILKVDLSNPLFEDTPILLFANDSDPSSGGIFLDMGDDNLSDLLSFSSIERLDITGTLGDDFLQGSDGDDRFSGNDGDDFISAGKGNDFLLGNWGDDYISGWDGNDFILGNLGDDSLAGEEGNDSLFGGKNNDFLQGGGGNDFLNGGDNNDILYGGTANDTLVGGLDGDRFLVGLGIGSALILDFESKDEIDLLLPDGQNLLLAGVLPNSQFATVTSDAAAEISAAQIVYNSSNGNLSYNQNGVEAGLGQGSRFATLSNRATLTAANIVLF